MNVGLSEAKSEIVLFLDDDIIPTEDLVFVHANAHKRTDADLVAGRVIQPRDSGFEHKDCHSFRSSSKRRQWANEFMGGNFSVRRSTALKIGGFDENFVKVAYRFERDFADRLMAAGGKILLEPDAVIRHLKLPHGGTRSYGNHLTTFKPNHAVGEYYYLLRTNRVPKRFLSIFVRPFRSMSSNHHFHRPWWIPITLTAETLGFFWAIFLVMRGPRYLGWDQQV
jgi:GT2 family glycosyltransferase